MSSGEVEHLVIIGMFVLLLVGIPLAASWSVSIVNTQLAILQTLTRTLQAQTRELAGLTTLLYAEVHRASDHSQTSPRIEASGESSPLP